MKSRPNRSPLRNRVIHKDAQLRLSEYNRDVKAWNHAEEGNRLKNDAAATLTRDIAHANHGRDFRFLPFPHGSDVEPHKILVRIAGLNANGPHASIYNYCNPSVENA